MTANHPDVEVRARRRWFRYSLRTLLLVVLALSVWLAFVTKTAQRQREAVSRIHTLGGIVRYEYQFRNGVFRPDILSPLPAWLDGIIDDDLVYNVIKIDVSKTGFCDEDVAQIRALSHLKWLHAGDTALSDRGVSAIAGLSELEGLNLDGTNVSDDGVQHIAKMKSLRKLWLSRTRITNRGLETIGKMHQLRGLCFGDTLTDENAFGALHRLTHLTDIHFARTGIRLEKFSEEFPRVVIWP